MTIFIETVDESGNITRHDISDDVEGLYDHALHGDYPEYVIEELARVGSLAGFELPRCREWFDDIGSRVPDSPHTWGPCGLTALHHGKHRGVVRSNFGPYLGTARTPSRQELFVAEWTDSSEFTKVPE